MTTEKPSNKAPYILKPEGRGLTVLGESAGKSQQSTPFWIIIVEVAF
jgi:hypothetical protein